MILVNLLVFSTQTYHKMKDEMLKLTEICSATHWLWTKKVIWKEETTSGPRLIEGILQRQIASLQKSDGFVL